MPPRLGDSAKSTLRLETHRQRIRSRHGSGLPRRWRRLTESALAEYSVETSASAPAPNEED